MRQLMTELCGIGLLAALAGCQPELAQVQEGRREAQWHQAIKESYSGFRPPRMAAPAVKDNMSPRVAEDEEREAAAAAEAPAQEDPVIEEEVEVETVVVEAEAPQKEAAEEEKGEEPAPEPDAAAAPEAPAAVTVGECEEYEVKAGDTLSHIARKFYGKASLADVILKANSATVSDPKRLKPGMKLQIPKL